MRDLILAQSAQNRVLIMVIGALSLILVALVWLLSLSQRNIEVYQIPHLEIPTQTRVDYVAPANVYSFVAASWPAIQGFATDGDLEAAQNLESFAGYLSKRFKAQLQAEAIQMQKSKQLKGRQREISVAPEYFAPEESVQQVASNLWDVSIVFEVREFLEGRLIKDVLISYPFRVQKVSHNHVHNPYGLEIVGFSGEPKRVGDKA